MEQTLLLNATYEPLKVVHWQKAVTLWCQGKVEIVAVHDREIRAVSFSFKLPSVIRLLRYVRIKKRFDYVPFSRANIYARDGYKLSVLRGTRSPPPSSRSITSCRCPRAAARTGRTSSRAACRATGARADARPQEARHAPGAPRRGVPTRRRPSASRLDCATRPTAGATICTGISSWTSITGAPRLRTAVDAPVRPPRSGTSGGNPRGCGFAYHGLVSAAGEAELTSLEPLARRRGRTAVAARHRLSDADLAARRVHHRRRPGAHRLCGARSHRARSARRVWKAARRR